MNNQKHTGQLSVGDTAPEFNLPDAQGSMHKLADYQGKWLVLYFYPKDNTPGCIQEGRDFRDHIEKFSALNCVVLGVSRDSVRVHEGFKTRQEFPFDLLSDKEETLCNLFDVIKMKNMYGKQVRGIERSTFLIDEAGILQQEWRKVKAKVHVAEVLDFLSSQEN